VPLAALADLVTQGRIQAGERVVCICSGAGFKDTHLAQAKALAVNQQEPVAFDVEVIVGQVTG
jgi:threonine synthase